MKIPKPFKAPTTGRQNISSAPLAASNSRIFVRKNLALFVCRAAANREHSRGAQ